MSSRPYKRRRKLIKPRLQLKLTFTFVGLAALSLLLQFVLFTNALTKAALVLPHDGMLLLEHANGLLAEVLLFSLCAFLPITFAIGILTTFRIAGPVYRFETFLRQIESGENPPDFRLRKHDELTDLARVLNRVTRPLRTLEDAAPDANPDVAPSLIRSRETRDPEESRESLT